MVYALFKKHHGPDGDPRCIVAHGSTSDLNPSIKQSVIDRAYADDAAAAAAEYGAEFRQPQTGYLTREIIERCVEKGTGPRKRWPGIQYRAWTDPATGAGQDSWTLCIAHSAKDESRDVTVIDTIYESKPPFDPETIVAGICRELQAWGLSEVMGDGYGKPFINMFRKHGITYKVAPVTTTDIYLHCLPQWTAGNVVLLDRKSVV